MIIFDTETTSLYVEDGQIAQLSYIKLNKKNEIEYAKNFYFTVEEVDIKALDVHGLDVETLVELSNNKKFADFAEEIYVDFNSADLLIAHNVSFDKKFLLEEFKRLDMDILNLEQNKKYFCTMDYYTEILKLEHSFYGYKFPRLSEVIRFLNLDDCMLKEETSKIFNVTVDELEYHDARLDVFATLNAYMSKDKDFERFKNMRYITSLCDNLNKKAKKLMDFLAEYNVDNFQDLSILDLDNVDTLIQLEEEEKCRYCISSSLTDLKANTDSILKVIEQEVEKNKRAKERKLAEHIETVLNNQDTVVRKAFLISRLDSEYRGNKHILFDLQAEKAINGDCYHDVDLIEIDKNKYLATTFNDEYAYIITVKNSKKHDETFHVIGDDYFNAHIVTSIEKCPVEVEFSHRTYSIKDYRTVLSVPLQNRNTIKNKKSSSEVSRDLKNDDEIPF